MRQHRTRVFGSPAAGQTITEDRVRHRDQGEMHRRQQQHDRQPQGVDPQLAGPADPPHEHGREKAGTTDDGLVRQRQGTFAGRRTGQPVPQSAGSFAGQAGGPGPVCRLAGESAGVCIVPRTRCGARRRGFPQPQRCPATTSGIPLYWRRRLERWRGRRARCCAGGGLLAWQQTIFDVASPAHCCSSPLM
jgi:hypothetical protein